MKRRWVRASLDEQVKEKENEDYFMGSLPRLPQEDSSGTRRDENRIDFFSEINTSSILELSGHLRAACMEMRQVGLVFGIEPPAVHLHIHSEGGDLFAGMAGMDLIRELIKHGPIHTHIDGQAASAATLLSCAGTRRTIGKHGFILIHQLSAGFHGKYQEMKEEMANNDMLMEKIITFYAQHSKMTAEQLSEALNSEIWFDADTALELGLVDEIR